VQKEKKVIHKPFLSKLIPAIVVGVLLMAPMASAAGEEKDKVLARIGSETITEEDLTELANAVPEKLRYLYLTPEGKKQTLEYIVNVYVLAAQAKKDGLDKSPKFEQIMNFTGRDLLARLYLEKMNKNLPAPTDKEAKEFYDKNKDQYAAPEAVHLRHILLKTDKEADDVLKRLKKGEKFADLASKLSIGPTKATGGDLDWLPRGRLIKEIEEVAFSMKKGQVTGPIKTKFGYHVLLLEDKRPERVSPFDEVKDYITEQLKFQKQQENYEKVAASLRKKMDVQVTAPTAPAQAKPGAPAGPTAAPKKK